MVEEVHSFFSGTISHLADSTCSVFFSTALHRLTQDAGETRILFQTRPGLGPEGLLHPRLAVDPPHHLLLAAKIMKRISH